MAVVNDLSTGYTHKHVADFAEQLQRLRNETAGVQILLHELAGLLTKPRARTFANEGIGRRLRVVARSALNVFALYPPGEKALLSREACDDVAIQFHAFAINLYAIFDNIAWVCMLEGGGSLPPLKVSLFKRECEAFLPPELREYLAREVTKSWFDQYGKVYRDSTAHRIAPYVPPRMYTPEEGQKFADLHSRANSAIADAAKVMMLDSKRGHELLNLQVSLLKEKESIGSNSLYLALSLTGDDATRPVLLHPQLICDWGLANEVLRIFDSAIRTQYGWPVREIPELRINVS